MSKTKNAMIWDEEVGHLPIQTPYKISEGSSLVDAITSMQKNKTGCILVVDQNDKLKGLITERDIMTKFVGTSLSGDTPVEELMTPDPMTLPYNASVSEASQCMGTKHFRHLPIIGKNKKVKGILSVRVLIYFIAEHLPSAVLNLPPDEKKIPKYVEGG